MRNTTISINGEDVPGYIAIPASGSGPAVIVIQEWWGLVPHIVDVVDRLAAEGFVALAVDHYRGAETVEPDEAKKLMIGLNIGQVADDLTAAAAALVARDEVVGDAVRVVGFCMGGGLALLAPTVSDDICCAVAFYPAMPWPQYAPDWTRYAGKSAVVHKALSDEPGNGPVIAEYAEAITASGGSVEILEYPDSVHAFFNDARPEVFQPENAAAAWQRTLDAFRACTD
jgi:carboxymethylenebutenolidase